MNKYQVWTLAILAAFGGLLFYLGVGQDEIDLKYGLDLSGGSHLVFDADTSSIDPQNIDAAMQSLREVIERRVNVFGVSEPVVQVEKAGIGSGSVDQRLIVELPGVADVEEAVETIGRTPLLEFRLVNPDADAVLPEPDPETGEINEEEFAAALEERFIDTGLTGALLKEARLQFGSNTGVGPAEALVLVDFNKEGRELFTDITTQNVGQTLAIFLDGEAISLPRINEPIPGGTAVISGSFTPDEAKQLVDDLNLGALPVPVSLSSVQQIGATLGQQARSDGFKAGIIGITAVSIFLIFYYRASGVVATVSLAIYLAIMISLFKAIPVVLTAAGIAGFILSLGMAVDANVLIFERLKEELESGKDLKESIRVGFERAWPSIRDGNISSLITAVILYWIGTTLVKGFAVTFGLGVLVSMLSAVIVTRTFLLAIASLDKEEKLNKFFKAGFK